MVQGQKIRKNNNGPWNPVLTSTEHLTLTPYGFGLQAFDALAETVQKERTVILADRALWTVCLRSLQEVRI
jgi:predicted thioredoxin/glutaredoxin